MKLLLGLGQKNELERNEFKAALLEIKELGESRVIDQELKSVLEVETKKLRKYGLSSRGQNSWLLRNLRRCAIKINLSAQQTVDWNFLSVFMYTSLLGLCTHKWKST